jgi:hypothetical protein
MISEEADGLYRVLMEGLETFVALTRILDSRSEQVNYAYTEDGRRFISSNPGVREPFRPSKDQWYEDSPDARVSTHPGERGPGSATACSTAPRARDGADPIPRGETPGRLKAGLVQAALARYLGPPPWLAAAARPDAVRASFGRGNPIVNNLTYFIREYVSLCPCGEFLEWTDIFSTSRACAACTWMRMGDISLI